MDAELLSRVDVVEQMQAGSAVARTSSCAARPCATDAAPLRYPHIREEASRSGLLGPRRRPRAWARRRGRLLFTRTVHMHYSAHCSGGQERLGLVLGILSLCLYSPLGGLPWAPPWAPPFGPKRPLSAPKPSLIRILSLSGFFPLSV